MDTDTEKIHTLIRQYCQAALQKDPDSLLRLYDGQVRIFDLWDKASVHGMAEWAPIVRHWLGNLGPETVHVEFEQVEVQVGGDLAVLTAFVHYQARDAAGTALRKMKNRLTWSLARRGPDWRIVHQHTSIPIDPQKITPKFNA